MNIAFEQSALEFQELTNDMLADKKIRLSIARLDKLHADVSGNKLFKLHYFLQEALSSSHKKIITFGGAYSNHLVATAYACHALGLDAVGIVRKEAHEHESHTISRCRELGMQLIFTSRASYQGKSEEGFLNELIQTHGACTVVPEGGFHPKGAQGASLIMQRLLFLQPTHVCVPVGTATTIAGLLLESKDVAVIGFPVLKNMTDVYQRISTLTGRDKHARLTIFDTFHFGGYAKHSHDLLSFMNEFFYDYQIPLDFVYTAKMMYGVFEQIKAGFFPEGSHIVCLHTGGLQGNKSLHDSDLAF